VNRVEAATRPVFWHIEHSWFMYVLMVPSLAIFCYGLYRRYKFWRLGKPVARFDRPWERLRRVLVHVLGHGRFLRESIAGLMHGLIFWSMLLLFIGTVVVAIDTDLRIPIMRGWFYLLYQSLVLDVVGALGMVAWASPWSAGTSSGSPGCSTTGKARPRTRATG